ncbi:MAG: Asp-tRNA(Asn)/Glu-tRNA(Gln) amidotransferase subunit GatC [Candidatus Brocadiia bacterium]
MPITRHEAEHAAHLSRLELSEEELDRFAGQLDSILAYVEKLNELDTSDVEPMLHAIEGHQRTRPDRAGESLPREEALRNAPDSTRGCYKVPRIID